MSTYRDVGVVLRTQKLGEADRIITMLTRGRGVIRVAGKGVRKTSSRFGARLEPFMHVEFQCAVGRTLDIVTQVEIVHAFTRDLGSDYSAYTAGTAMLETAERIVADTEEPSVQQYQLLVSALLALTERRQPPSALMDSYQLRALAIAGYAPSFDGCARCGADVTCRYFHVPSGGLLCDDCRVPGSAVPGADTIALLGALLAGDWQRVEQSDERSRTAAGGIVAAYLSWHLERGLRSLAHVDRG